MIFKVNLLKTVLCWKVWLISRLEREIMMETVLCTWPFAREMVNGLAVLIIWFVMDYLKVIL